MGPIAIKVIEWAVAQGISSVSTSEEKAALSWVLTQVDALVQAADARVTGPFKGVTDEVAAGFSAGIAALTASLAS